MKKLLLIPALILFSSSWTFAQAQVSPPDGMSQIEAYSIFYENYKSDSYERAIKNGRWIWQGMPESIEGHSGFDLKRNLERLISAYGSLAEEKSDPSEKEAYADTALTIFEKVFDHFGEENLNTFDWHLERGRFYQTHSDYLSDASEKAAEDYLQAYKEDPEKFTKLGDGYYSQVMLRELVSLGEKDQALKIVKESEPYAATQLQDYFDDVRNKLFDSPEERITFLEGELEESPEDEEILQQLLDLYQEEDMRDKAVEISNKLYEINPNYENTMALAEMAQSNADYSEAINYLKEALNKTDDAEEKAEIALEISDAYLNQDELQDAREFANTAIDHDSDWGDPYIQIADIYARAVNNCTNNRKMDRTDKVVYWLVLDYLDQARQVDSSVSNEVDRKYQSYEPVTPTTEEKFFWQPPLEEGDEIEVDAELNECYDWISETTTVR